MAAGQHDITIEQGATFTKTLIYKDANGNPIDLTDVTEARAQMRPTASSNSYTDFVVTVDGDPTSGTLHWSMSATVTAAITVLTQVYDLEIEFTDGTVVRLLEGSVTVTSEVTRS